MDLVEQVKALVKHKHSDLVIKVHSLVKNSQFSMVRLLSLNASRKCNGVHHLYLPVPEVTAALDIGMVQDEAQT